MLKKLPTISWTKFGANVRLSSRWAQKCRSQQELQDLYDTDFVLERMPSWLSTWVRDKDPASFKEVLRIADQHVENQRRPQSDSSRRGQLHHDSDREEKNYSDRNMDKLSYDHQRSFRRKEQGRDDHRKQSPRPEGGRVAESNPEKGDSSSKPRYDREKGPRCYNCQNYGHIAVNCPKMVNAVTAPPWENSRNCFMLSGKVNGRRTIRSDLVDQPSGTSPKICQRSFTGEAPLQRQKCYSSWMERAQ